MKQFDFGKLQPIDFWLSLAHFVQKLNISDNNFFDNSNYESLANYFKKLDYQIPEETIMSILNDINAINSSYNYKKAYFLEQIYALYDLNVSKIAYLPNNFPQNVIGLTNTKLNKKSVCLTIAYTDGNFKMRKWDDFGFNKYSIIDLQDASYIIIKDVDKEENYIFNTFAYLKNFNGDFPSLSEMRKFKQAKLNSIKNNLYVEKYKTIERDNISCKDKLVLSLGKNKKHNQYYYK